VLAASPSGVTLEINGIRTWIAVAIDPADPHGARAVHVDGPMGSVSLRAVPRFTDPAARVATGSLLAPMPGSVVSVAVAEGDQVTAGQPVLVLEAMKMQHTVSAPHDGVVADLPVTVGAQVAAGAVLAVVQPVSTGSTNQGETDD
jgi:propionyl-CoA carboxylase alpha chain